MQGYGSWTFEITRDVSGLSVGAHTFTLRSSSSSGGQTNYAVDAHIHVWELNELTLL